MPRGTLLFVSPPLLASSWLNRIMQKSVSPLVVRFGREMVGCVGCWRPRGLACHRAVNGWPYSDVAFMLCGRLSDGHFFDQPMWSADATPIHGAAHRLPTKRQCPGQTRKLEPRSRPGRAHHRVSCRFCLGNSWSRKVVVSGERA